MTYNLKLGHKAVKFAYANRSTDVALNSTSVYSNVQYALTTLSGSTGLQATLSSGDIVLADKIYHGFFHPTSGGDDAFSMSVFINGSSLSTQRYLAKTFANPPSNRTTRSMPLFFSYVATSGDVLSIRYSKNPGSIYNIYSASIGTNLFLMDVDK